MREFLLFVDTETSGVPRNMNTSVAKTEQWPFVLQLSWRIYKSNGTLVKVEDHFIYEPEIDIESSSTKIHGITLSALRKKGKARKATVKKFINDLRYYKPLLIGHFIEFDSKMLQVMMMRCGLKNVLKEYPLFCTMRTTSEYSRAYNQNYPKLDELYETLFGEKLENHHNAAADVEATAKCFFELYRKGEISDNMTIRKPIFVRVKNEMKGKTGCGLPILFVLIVIITIAFS